MPTLSQLIPFIDYSQLERRVMQDLVLYGRSANVLVLDDIEAAPPRVTVSGRWSFQDFYGRAFTEIPTSNQGSPVMTEVTPVLATEPAAASADIHVRPPLPEGIKYMFDDCDRVTVTDVSGAPSGAFRSYGTMGYLYRNNPGAGFDTGAAYNLHNDVRRNVYHATSVVHLILHPVSQGYGESPSDSDHPGNFSLYTYSSGNPWKDFDWWKDNFLRWVEHMPAPSNKHPGLLMYFQSPEKRARNIRTPIKPGKYLTKFFSDVLSGEEINNMAVKWSAMATPPKLSVTADADEIEQLYKGKHNGSCMHFGTDGYEGSEHPARAYAGPDLAQAYIGDLDCADARCLVWPDKMIYYPKFYGDYRRLEGALEAAGYKRASEEAFFGARMQRIPHGNAFVAPYLDVGGYVCDDGEYLIIDDGDGNRPIPCRETEGLTKGRGRTCGYSGSTGHDEDDMIYVDGWGYICQDSYDDYFGSCIITDGHFHRDRMTVANDGEAYISDAVVSRERYTEQWYRCAYTDELYTDNYEPRVVMYDGEAYSRTAFDRYGATCEFSGENYPDDETTVLDNGKVVADHLIDETDHDYRVFAGLDVSDNEDVASFDEIEAA